MLSNAEVLAIILRNGIQGKNAIELSNDLLSKIGLHKLSKMSLKELQKIKGIGKAKSMLIKALFEFNKRCKFNGNKNKTIKSAKDVYRYASQKIIQSEQENFMIIHLNARNKILKHEIVSIGTLNSTIIHPREVFKSAIKESANSIIVVHNHPSGDPSPSEEDKEITKKLFESGDLLDIKVLDHVIIGGKKYYSFREKSES